ncbi:AI-2E family transporter [Agaribacter marinus]|uniref:AI-2E family transporter n=1 Tax=Virgibacillus salarius TaxID=447199 RepID=A0A941ICI6_9BACI|nr:AI-2E family transporter [Virgibacillus salarius]MBR7797536.1 AI-2E family transporter [Virgibacillus salarius]NAZ10246.1 AI-2E family transporter [Agaribacter marinus]
MFKNNKRLNFLYWLLIGIFLFLFIFLLIKLFPFYKTVFLFLWHLLAPFLISCLIAYLLYPVVNKLHSYNIPRGIAVLLIYLLFFGGTAYLIYRVYPMIVTQVRELNEQLPQFINMYEKLIYQMYEYTSFLPETVHDKFDHLIAKVENGLDRLLARLVNGFTKVFDFIIFITVIPVLVFYFLKDYDKIKAYFKRFIPKKYRSQSSKMVHAIDETLGDYIRGQLLVCLFVSLTSLIIFKLLGMDFALLLAILMGITNLIPYFGPIIGAAPAVAIALTVSGKLVIFVIVAVFIIQLIESNLLSPYIVGKSINIHPIAIIFALLLGGQLFGIVGMIIAVPTMTIAKVIIKHVIHWRQFRSKEQEG